MTKKRSYLPAKSEIQESVKFSGYSIDELRYKIVYTSLQKEFCKDKFFGTLHKAVDSTPIIGKGSKQSPLAVGGGILSKVLKTLSYADYMLVGFSVFKTIKNVVSLFHRKK